MGLETFLFALSAVMFGAQLLAWRWSRRLEMNLKGRDGYDLAQLLTWIIAWSTLARFVGVIATFTLGLDRSNLDQTMALALLAQILGAAIFVGAAIKVWRISRDRDDDPDTSGAQGPQGGKGVGVQVDQISVPPAVAVDDMDANTALSGAH